MKTMIVTLIAALAFVTVPTASANHITCGPPSAEVGPVNVWDGTTCTGASVELERAACMFFHYYDYNVTVVILHGTTPCTIVGVWHH